MRRVADDDPRWRQSAHGYGCNAAGRMDPPPRSLARRSVRLLHGRDPTWFNRIQAWFAGDCSWPMAGSPRIIAWQTTRSRAVCRRARVGQGQAFGGAEEAPSLTLAARDGDGQYAVGAEECSRRGSNKRINKQGREGATKWCAPPLTKKARMPELGSYGSVRGARGNSRPYRESRRYTTRQAVSLEGSCSARRTGAPTVLG